MTACNHCYGRSANDRCLNCGAYLPARAALAADPQPSRVEQEINDAFLSLCETVGVPATAFAAQEYRARNKTNPDPVAWRNFSEAPMDGTPILIEDDGFSVSVKWKAYDEEAAAECGAPGYWTYSDPLLEDVCPGGPEVPFRWLPDPIVAKR